MKSLKIKLLVLLLCTTGSLLFAQGLSGNTIVCAEVSEPYSYEDDAFYYTSIQWMATGGSISGSGFVRNIIWHTSGTLSLKFYNGSTYIKTIPFDITVKTTGYIHNVPNPYTACPNTPITLASSGGEGQTFVWQKSPSGQNSWSYVTTTGPNASISPQITQNTDFRIVGECANSVSPTTTVILYAATTAGSISGGGAVCYNTSATLSNVVGASGGPIASYQWQSLVSGGSWTDISGAVFHSYTSVPLTQATSFRRKATGCVGPAVYSNTISISIDQPSSGTLSLAGGSSYFNAGDNMNLTIAGQQGSVTSYYYTYQDQNGSGTWQGPVAYGSSLIPSAAGQINRIYNLYATVKSGTCPAITTNTVTANVFTAYGGTVAPVQVEEYGIATGKFKVTKNASDVVTGWESSTNSGTTWTPISNTTDSLKYYDVTVNTWYRAKVKTTLGSQNRTNTSSIGKLVIYPAIGLTNNSTPSLALGTTVTLSANSIFAEYKWYFNGNVIPGQTSSTITAREPGTYELEVKANASAIAKKSGAITVFPIGALADTTVNRIVTTVIKKGGVTSTTNLYTTLQPEDYAQSISYLDGKTRPLQTVAIGQSPSMKDIVQSHMYDSTFLEPTVYLPYVSSTRDGYRRPNDLKGGAAAGTYTTSDQYLFYQNAVKVEHDTKPYATTVFENSPLTRIKEKGAPGTDWQPGTHTAKSEMHVNVAGDNVKQWTAAGPGANYLASMLTVSKVIDENGNSVVAFTDKLGRTVLKRVQIDATVEGTFASWLETYYVYDIRGNLIMQVPPKAAAKLNSGTAWSTTFRDQWCFVYTYDARNRLVEKKTPDAAVVYFGYDPLGRLVLSQDGNLRTQNKWSFIKYDALGRAVITGLYTNTTHTTRPAIQANVLDVLYPNASDVYYEQRGTALHGYTNVSFPTANAPSGAIDVYGVNYYNTYDFDYNGTDDYSYTVQNLAGEGAQGNSFGLPTGSKRIIPGTSTWLYAYQFYDKYARAIQTRSNNHLSAAIDNLTTMVYDFEGKVLLTKKYHNAGGTNQVTVVNKMKYDHAGRLLKIYQNINNMTNDRLVAKYNYNELGQMVEKNLHLLYDAQEGQPGGVLPDDITLSQYSASQSNITMANSIRLLPGFDANAQTGGTFWGKIKQVSQTTAETNGLFLQSVDYRYNIRGWLSSINNAQLNNDALMNDDTNDYFGMELLYNKADATLGNAASYNGNISAIKWKGVDGGGAANQRSYKYTYDKTDKLTAATYQKFGTAAWDKEVGALNETQSYDANGNILSLQRTRIKRDITAGFAVSTTAETLDNLAYTYSASTANQLAKVEDTGLTDGFKNGASIATEYTYNTDGSLTADKNKGIDSVKYNELGKVKRVKFTDGRVMTYVYDGAGSKLTTKTYSTTGVLQTTTDYVGSFVYENNALSFFASPEGRIIKNGSNFEYQYSIADHQGNTRVVFSAVAPAPDTYTATYEDNTLTNEQSTFQNYPTGAGRSSLELFDHTDISGAVYSRSQLLNGGNNSQVGLAKTLKVYPGDVIHAEAYAKYWNATSTTSNISAFGAALTSAFGVTAGSTGEALKAFTALNNYGGIVAGAGGSGSPTAPKAFITILLFDQNFNFVNTYFDQIGTAGEQVGATPKGPFDLLSPADVTVKEAGYAYIYVSNENPTQVDVYFDDLKIIHNKSNVIQYNEYYPFGMQNQNSWTRENVKGNNFLGNGGTEFNSASNLYDLDYRNYDPILGRMNGVDPMADKYAGLTTYNYAFNNPVSFNDPSGADPADQGYYMYLEQRAQNMASVNIGAATVYNDLSSIDRGGSALSIFNSGWAPGSGSLSASYFALGDAYLNPQNNNKPGSFVDEVNELVSLLQDGETPILDAVTIEKARSNSDFLQESIDGYYQTQGGLSIITYQKDQGKNLGGLKIELGFVDSDGKYDDLRWVQTIWTGSRKPGVRSPYNDPQPPDDRMPFYYTEEETSFHQNRGGYNATFSDWPGRDIEKNAYWFAELSLVSRQSNGTYSPVLTVNYGFIINNGAVSLFPFSYAEPSKIHLNSFVNKTY